MFSSNPICNKGNACFKKIWSILHNSCGGKKKLWWSHSTPTQLTKSRQCDYSEAWVAQEPDISIRSWKKPKQNCLKFIRRTQRRLKWMLMQLHVCCASRLPVTTSMFRAIKSRPHGMSFSDMVTIRLNFCPFWSQWLNWVMREQKTDALTY